MLQKFIVLSCLNCTYHKRGPKKEPFKLLKSVVTCPGYGTWSAAASRWRPSATTRSSRTGWTGTRCARTRWRTAAGTRSCTSSRRARSPELSLMWVSCFPVYLLPVTSNSFCLDGCFLVYLAHCVWWHNYTVLISYKNILKLTYIITFQTAVNIHVRILGERGINPYNKLL